MRNKCTKVNKHLVQCLAHGKVSVSQLLLTPSFFFFFLINLFILFGCIGSLLLHAGFLQLWGVGASHCGGFSCCGVQALGMRAPVVVTHGLRCSAACGIFPDQGSNTCPLHWQADSQPLRHQGSPTPSFLIIIFIIIRFFPPFSLLNKNQLMNC